MVQQKYGKMVFLSSTSALGNRGQTNYSAAKAGLQGRARTLAIELGPFNVNVNAVAPGFIETRMTRATAERMGVDFEAFKVGAASQIPLRRVGQPEDIANAIAFLCSDESSFISGQTIYVGGDPQPHKASPHSLPGSRGTRRPAPARSYESQRWTIPMGRLLGQ